MAHGFRPFIAGDLGRIAVERCQNLLGIGRGNVIDFFRRPHICTVLIPLGRPGVVGIPGVGQYAVAVAGSFVHVDELHLEVVRVIDIVPVPGTFAVYGSDYLVAARSAVTAPVR